MQAAGRVVWLHWMESLWASGIRWLWSLWLWTGFVHAGGRWCRLFPGCPCPAEAALFAGHVAPALHFHVSLKFFYISFFPCLLSIPLFFRILFVFGLEPIALHWRFRSLLAKRAVCWRWQNSDMLPFSNSFLQAKNIKRACICSGVCVCYLPNLVSSKPPTISMCEFTDR